MKVGDVVNFQTKSWVFKHADDRYSNPGIIIERIAHNVAEVYWRDGRITREHRSYLAEVTGENR